MALGVFLPTCLPLHRFVNSTIIDRIDTSLDPKLAIRLIKMPRPNGHSTGIDRPHTHALLLDGFIAFSHKKRRPQLNDGRPAAFTVELAPDANHVGIIDQDLDGLQASVDVMQHRADRCPIDRNTLLNHGLILP